MHAAITTSTSLPQLQNRRPFSSRSHRTTSSVRSQQRHICQAKAQDAAVSRRDVALAGFAALIAVPAGSAQAGLLGGTDKNEIYTQDTSLLLSKVKDGLDLPKDASNREEVFQDIKDKTTKWVAKYRREGSFQGRASYSTTYSAVNALAGHFNSFGLTAPVPKKRLDRIQKELVDADRALKRGR